MLLVASAFYSRKGSTWAASPFLRGIVPFLVFPLLPVLVVGMVRSSHFRFASCSVAHTMDCIWIAVCSVDVLPSSPFLGYVWYPFALLLSSDLDCGFFYGLPPVLHGICLV